MQATEVTGYSDYRAYLKDILSQRAQTNSRYSLRAFARDLKITPARLSEVLNRKKGLSLEAATKISQRLSHNDEETSYFCDLVQLSDARSPGIRKVAELRIDRATKSNDYDELHADVLKVISDWHHFAILELTQVEGFKSDTAWIAKTLGLSKLETQTAIDRLVKLNLLQETRGRLKKTNERLTTTRDIPSTSIRNFQRQILQKASQALEAQTLEERDFSTMTLAIDQRKIPEAKKMIVNFRRQLTEFLETGPRNKVYCLGIQLFKLND